MDQAIQWLLEGDAGIRWQVMRDLMDAPAEQWQAERKNVATAGWGARLLSKQRKDGNWGGGVYSPKWTSTTYTLLQLHDLGLSQANPQAQRGTKILLDQMLGPEGTGIFEKNLEALDLCVVGMILELAVYFNVMDTRIEAIIDHLLEHQMSDGGWNCNSKKKRGAVHSSFHTTFNVLDGLRTCLECGLKKRRAALRTAEQQALEMMLEHRLFRSDKTEKVIREAFLKFSYPFYWYYDVLRGLDYFQSIQAKRDERLEDAIELLRSKRRKDGLWPVQNRHPGKTFFEMEKTGRPSRWNTLRALRVLRWWDSKSQTKHG